MKNLNRCIHPGTYIKNQVLSVKKISVTEAAKLLGVSRPNVSKFLNAKAAASSKMASRIEQVFGIPAQSILDMQIAFNLKNNQAEQLSEQVRQYVPAFLSIKADDIIEFFSRPTSRGKLAVLLRTLINSTVGGIEKIDFPGYEDAERSGWDGRIVLDVGEGNPWVPVGQTLWEYGVSPKVKAKADSDWGKRTASTSQEIRNNATFVFVTTNRWPGKTKWVEEKMAQNQWEDVRAYDASDLEQWMEQSLVAQTWFANQTNRFCENVRTLDRCWSDWADVTKPHLGASLFTTEVQKHKDKIRQFFNSEIGTVLKIVADSVEEGLAFLCQALSVPELSQHRDKILVFDKPGTLPKLASGKTSFVAVTFSREVERELGPYSNFLKSVVIYPRYAAHFQAEVELNSVLDSRAFSGALSEMGVSNDEIRKLESETGRSLTVLRRRLSVVPAIQVPDWASDSQIALTLIPFVLIGTWTQSNKHDWDILARLAEVSCDSLDAQFTELLQLNDSPVWVQGGYQGVTSKLDAFFAVAPRITQFYLKRFYELAHEVLSEDNPVLELPSNERWRATGEKWQRKYSDVLRRSIATTVALLAMHGKAFFAKRGLPFDCEIEAAKLIRSLFTPLTIRKLEATNAELPLLAEAAPLAFLDIVEHDLANENSETKSLCQLERSAIFESCPRTGLLWSLECLAWSPLYFPRVINILGILSEIKNDDKWCNKPIQSLSMIFQSWMPQTAANHQMRLEALRMLLNQHESVGWKICTAQFSNFKTLVGDYSYKPKWRSEGYGVEEQFKTWGPIVAFKQDAIKLALQRPVYTAEMLCDLIIRLPVIEGPEQERVWALLKEWRESNPSDDDIVKVRAKIAQVFLSRQGRERYSSDLAFYQKAKSIYDYLKPNSDVNQYKYLFRKGRVYLLDDEIDEDLTDWRARQNRIAKLRTEAVSSIVSAKGIRGAIDFATKVELKSEVGVQLAQVLTIEQIESFIRQVFELGLKESNLEELIRWLLSAIGVEKRQSLYSKMIGSLKEEEAFQLLLHSPYDSLTWMQLEKLTPIWDKRYWQEVTPRYVQERPDELAKSVSALLECNRPKAAFASIQYCLQSVPLGLLAQILFGMAKKSSNKLDDEHVDEYCLEEALKLTIEAPELPLDQKIRLEFLYLNVLAPLHKKFEPPHIPNLELYIEMHPEFFMQLLIWVFKREDQETVHSTDVESLENSEQLVHQSYHLLEVLCRIPGSDQETKEKKVNVLRAWIEKVRTKAIHHGRAGIADLCIGKFMAKALVGKDTLGPDEKAVLDVIEEVHSDEIGDGVRSTLYNSRGVFWLGENGDQERKIADKYCRWAHELQFSHRFVCSIMTNMVKVYENEAEHQDADGGVRRRLGYIR